MVTSVVEIIKITSTAIVFSIITHVGGRKYDKHMIMIVAVSGISLIVLGGIKGFVPEFATTDNFKHGLEVLKESASLENFGKGIKVIGEWGAGMVKEACDWVVGLFK